MDIVPDDVVIGGISGHFPKATNIEEFKNRLFENKVLIESKWPDEKNFCNKIGCIESDYFDNSYFGIHRQQCFFMDPMHRHALELTFEALLDAGINPTEVRGKRIGVFMGSTIGENDQLFMESVVSGFGVTGHSRAMLANRISYWLNLKGPSVAYDSNWISGLEVLRLAYYAIKTGQCDSVIVGTTNLAEHPEFQFMYNDMGLLSQDGSTNAFDANASGYARSEGAVVMYIQRSSQARRHYASIVHIDTKFDGTTSGDFMTVDSKHMIEFLEEFYEKSKVKPEEIDFVEAYGCGLKNIDKCEIDSLEQVFCKERTTPLLVGSVKTVTGHSEPTAALFSIVKTLIAMETDTIPATLQYKTPNPEIQALNNGKVEITTTNRKWEPKYAAVNAVGISANFGHVVLKANPKKKAITPLDMPSLLIASTRTEEGITNILETLKKKQKDPEYYKLIQDVFSKSIQGHLYRGYLLLGQDEPKLETNNHMGNKRPIWFVYSGMGSQWNEMLGDLMKIEVFAESIKRSEAILAAKGVDLMQILSSSDKTVFDNILNCFVGIAAMQIALTDLLRALGIVPDGIIGHSVGELGCAYADGCMTAEQMILSSYSRGRASIEATLIKGMMAAVGLGYNQIKNRLPPAIEVACHNGPDSCTISGPVEEMEVYVKSLKSEGVFAKLVNVADIAYHSRYIKPAAPLLLRYLKDVLPNPMVRSSKWISTSNLESNWDTELAKHSSADYHTNNLLSSVLFEEGIKHIPKEAILIEIAPHGLLQAILKRSVKDCTSIPLTQRGTKSGTEFLLQGLGKMYLAGIDMKLSNIYPKIEYPVSRNTPSLTDLIHWNHTESWSRAEDVQKSVVGVRNVDVSLNSEEFGDTEGHKFHEEIVFPLSTYLNIILQITDNAFGGHGITFENIMIKKDLVIPALGIIPLNAMVQHGSGEFEIFSGNDLIISGKLSIIEDKEDPLLENIEIPLNKDSMEISENEIYDEFKHRGYGFGGRYQCLKSINIGAKGSVSTMEWKNQWTDLIEALVQQQLFHVGERNQGIYVPRYIRKIIMCHSELPTTTTDVKTNYEYATKTLSTSGIEIHDMRTSPYGKKPQNIQINTFDIVQLENNILNNIESGIERALQLAIASFNEPSIRKIYICELETNNTLQDELKIVLSDFDNYYVNSNIVKEIKQVVIVESFPQLLIMNGMVNSEILNLLNNFESTFLLAKKDPSQQLPQSICIVSEFRFGPDHYIIARKASTIKHHTVTIKESKISIKDLEKKSVPWVTQLTNIAKETAEEKNSIMLVTSAVPSEGFNNFLQGIRNIKIFQNVRVFFNLDQNPHKLAEAHKKDLSLLVLKDNQWYTCLPLSIARQDRIQDPVREAPIINNKVISYIGINLKDETLAPEIRNNNEIGNIDYCGVSKNGERVLGLAYLDKETSKLVVDDIFTWEVPEEWSLDSAVTVPHAYVSAYYMLVVKANLKHGETVLIHAGCSPIGLAALSICYGYGCQIFTTVSSNRQKAYIKQNLSFVQERNILNSNSEKFESDLLSITGGKGAEVILNCVSGRLLKCSVGCIASYGRFIQYGKYDMEQGNSIGMRIFLKNVSFYHVDLQNVFNQRKEIKQEIRDLIKEGFEKFVVRPLCKEIITDNNMATAMKKLQSTEVIGKIIVDAGRIQRINQLNINDPHRFITNPKNSYLIFGGSAENWINIAEWLVHRGARKIVVSNSNKLIARNLHRRLSILESYYGADIIMASSKISPEGIKNVVSEVLNLGNIHAVFTLPCEPDSSPYDAEVVEIFDDVLRKVAPEALLINLLKSATGVCYKRAILNYPTCNIQFPEQEKLNDVISSLDFILYSNFWNVIVRKQEKGASLDDNNKSCIKDIYKLIPNVDDIIQLQKNASNEPEFLQVLTEGPVEIRELAPVFIIPGITGYKELAEFVKHLLYPTFCAVYPRTPWSLDKLADVYAQKIVEIYPRDCYNIVSISSGGALAIEIAKRLTKKNYGPHLYFLDSAPLRIQQGLQDIGENSFQVETSLLRIVFEINDIELIKQLKSCPNFEARIQLLVQRLDLSDKHKERLETGLIFIKDFIEQLQSYKPNNELASGKVHLLVPDDCNAFDTYGIPSYCKNPPTVTQIVGDHLSIISHTDTHEYVNKNHYQL